MVGGGAFVSHILILLMILALMLSIMTAMAGSSRTLYQGSVDGWLPRYLSHVNEHGAPTRAMWTDLIVNLFALAIAAADATSFFFLLAVSNVGYIIFNFLNLNAGWIHRVDNAHVKRPWKAPTVLLALGTIFAFVNAAFMGAGAKVWNPSALMAGFITAAMIIPGLPVSPLCAGQGHLPRSHAGRPATDREGHGGAQGRHLALRDPAGRRRRGAHRQPHFVLPG